MKLSCIATLAYFLLLIFSSSRTSSADGHDNFLKCLSKESYNYSISNQVYTPNNSSFTSILRFSIRNLRFTSESTPKPHVILTPEYESQIPPIIYCAKESDLEIRTRSGGHDFEGLSYVAQVPFVIIDLIYLSEISVDVEEKTAWVGAGATVGSLFYRIAEKSSTLAFPTGTCTTIGVGGHFSGGGYGPLHRKYGLSADNVIDARIIDVNGKILDRKSMGEDLFWAIRGGGGASFGVIVAWKVRLVDVPERVTVFTIQRTSEQNATQLVHHWQYVAPRIEHDLFLMTIIRRVNSTQDGRDNTISASFIALFLGGIDKLLPLMQESFPELGLVREDCIEMSWLQSTLYFFGSPIESPELLLNRTQPNLRNFKVKQDYVRKPIPKYGFEGIWKYYYESEAKEAQLVLIPYGGRMDEIPESALPFPHRAGTLYQISHMAFWKENEASNSNKYMRWVRKVYSYMTPYVSKNPRAAYLNYRDLDFGVNNNEGTTSYEEASIWGVRYFKNNFDRLVRVKTAVDPKNFFRNEQSVPTLYPS